MSGYPDVERLHRELHRSSLNPVRILRYSGQASVQILSGVLWRWYRSWATIYEVPCNARGTRNDEQHHDSGSSTSSAACCLGESLELFL